MHGSSRTNSLVRTLVGGNPPNTDGMQAFIQILGQLEKLDASTQKVAEVRYRAVDIKQLTKLMRLVA